MKENIVLFTGSYLIASFLCYVYRNELKKIFLLFWENGNFFGKFIVVVCATFILPNFVLPLVVYGAYMFLVMVVKGIAEGIIHMCFPRLVCERIEVPLPDEEILQRLREEKIDFVIGKSCLVFNSRGDYLDGKKVMEQKNIHYAKEE